MTNENADKYSRRDFFTGIARRLTERLTAAGNAFEQNSVVGDTDATGQTTPESELAAAFLRPPGALPEDLFLAACTRQGDCVKACPYDAIVILGDEYHEAAGTPAILPAESPCYLCPDLPCLEMCTTGALQQVLAVTEVRMGIAQIDLGRCSVSQGQLCDYCVLRCPLTRRAIDWDAKRRPTIIADGCAGCGVCAYLCPTDAIVITARPGNCRDPQTDPGEGKPLT